MKMVKRELIRPKYYMPASELIRFMTQRLQFERTLAEKTSAGKELSEEEERIQRTLATSKSRLVDKIFQQMADLTYFFESISSHQELQELFDEDLIDLLGLRQEEQQSSILSHGKKYPIYFKPDTFRRQVSAALAVENREDLTFRKTLPKTLQQIIESKMRWQTGENPAGIKEIMRSDIARAVAWTALYAADAPKLHDSYRRALGYSFHPIVQSRSFKDELNRHNKIL